MAQTPEAKRKAIEAAKRAAEKMQASLKFLSQTEEGIHVLRFLFLRSGFNQSSVAVNTTGKVDIEATFYNTVRRDLYSELRNLMPPEVIKIIELDIPKMDIVKEEEKTDVPTLA